MIGCVAVQQDILGCQTVVSDQGMGCRLQYWLQAILEHLEVHHSTAACARSADMKRHASRQASAHDADAGRVVHQHSQGGQPRVCCETVRRAASCLPVQTSLEGRRFAADPAADTQRQAAAAADLVNMQGCEELPGMLRSLTRGISAWL